MTSDERALVLEMVTKELPKGVFLQRFRSAKDGKKLTLTLLEEGLHGRSTEDVDCAILVGFTFGFDATHIDALCSLAVEEWHHSHENIVMALDKINDGRAIDTLFHLTQVIPNYLEYDESRALAVKAIWALGKLGAIEALQTVAESDDPILKANALKQLGLARSANEKP